MSQINKKDAIRELWYRGTLTSWKLHSAQKKILSSYLSQNKEITVIGCSRRFGKSFWLFVMAAETCMKTPNSIVKYVCPKKNMVKNILHPIFNELFKDCPAELKPEYKTNDYCYVFPNGSQIQMAGTDNGHHETLRGSKSDLWIVDEAGFCDDLNYVVNTILAPTTDTTGGRGIIASTPSKSSDHEFITDFWLPATHAGELIKYTIHDNPLLTKDKVKDIINRYPLKERDPEFRREYLCDIIQNDGNAVVPEFTEDLQEKIIKEVQKPPFFDSYVAMDIGGTDLTVLLFAYYDFKNARTVIEDELVFSKKGNSRFGSEDKGFIVLPEFRSDIFAKLVKEKEEGLWSHPLTKEMRPPYLRIADNNNVYFLNDLRNKYALSFIPTRKDNRDAALNTMRVALAEERIIIHPRCKTLIHHLKYGTWAKNKKDFTRTSENGHWDAIPALMYLMRNVQFNKNPYPAGYDYTSTGNFFEPNKQQKRTEAQQAWVDLFRNRSSLKNKT